MSCRYEFHGRTVLVTGAAQGIGEGICRAFIRAGAQVWGSDVDSAGLADTSEACMQEVGAGNGGFRARVVDVSDPDAVDGWVRSALQETGRVDVLVHVAGGVLGQVGRPVEEVTEEDWRSILAVNLDGAFHGTRAVAPAMKKAGRGRIVVISSGAGLRVSLTGIQAYASAKSAQIGLVRQLAHELGPFGVTVNCVAPGFVRSNPSTERQWAAYGEEGQAQLLERIATRRLGRPEDIAHAVLFFASDEAEWITGETLSVDGGR
jgi:3-oxoacyl-[acyl-carrier protein] reductase